MSELVDKSCKDTVWFTPERVLQLVRLYFRFYGGGGEIDLDPATDPSNPTSAWRFYTEKDDGLALPWSNVVGVVRPANVWVNPPFGKVIRRWVEKIRLEAEAGARIVALLPGQRFEQEYWQRNLFIPALTGICFVRSRLAFERPIRNEAGEVIGRARAKGGNVFGSMLYVFGGDFGVMANAFRTLGMCAPIDGRRVVQHEPPAKAAKVTRVA